MRHSRAALYSWILVGAGMLSACGGGDTSFANVAPDAAALTLSGTAASGLAIAGASITAKCQSGNGAATTASDGNYQLHITGGTLPCMLELSNPADGKKLHGLAVSLTANITPLTEMLTARVLGQEPSTFFAAFDAATAARAITPNALLLAQADVGSVLQGAIDTSAIASFASTALMAASAANAAGGDAQDKLLDVLKGKLNATQLEQVVSALAQSSGNAAVKQMVVDRVAANQSQLTSTLNLSTNTVLLQWVDAFPGGTHYRIETQNADGSFSLVEAIAGVGGSGQAMQWQRALTVATIYRVVAVMASGTVVIATPQGQSSVSVSPSSASTASIALDQVEPVSGAVKLSIGSATAYPTVTWYSDLRLLGSGGAGVGNALTWNTSTETNSAHLVLAKVQVATDSYLEIRRTVSVSNANLAVSAGVSGTTGTITVDVSASSQFGIARVEAALDGVSVGSLTAPNACASRMACSSNNLYRFSLNAAAAGSGSHSMLVTATDSANNSKSTTVLVPISNLPGLVVNTPVDGGFVNGSLSLTGSYSTDKAGAVTVLASLGDYEFMRSTSQSFSASMSLAGLTPGSYTLTVRATDSSAGVTVIQRTVTVTSGAALAYTPSFTLGANGQLIAVDASNPATVLYKADDGSYRVRNTTANTEVTLQGASSIPYLYNWAMDGGYVFVEGGYLGSTGTGYSDCPLDCIYQFSPAGEKTNLSNVNPNAATSNVGGGRAYEQYPKAHGGNVIWIDAAGANAGTYTRYSVATGVYSTIAQPAGANYLGNTAYDFFVDAKGNVTFFYWAQTSGSGTTSVFDVYRWSSATLTSTKISIAGARSIYPQTDGQTVAWLQTPIGGNTSCSTTTVPCSAGSTIMSQALAGGATVAVSSNANDNFQLHDGVLAWTESSSAAIALKALVGGATSAISGAPSTVLYGAGGGFVVFGELGKTYSWNASTQSSKALIDAAPNQVMLSASTLYFVMGSSKVVYRLGLN